MPNYACQKHHLQCFDAHYLTEASCEISAWSLEDFLAEVEKAKKLTNYAKLC